MSHPAYTILFGVLVSGAIGLTGNRTAAGRLYRTTCVFLSCMVTVVAGGWIMFWIHG
jgi:hypothetical protein